LFASFRAFRATPHASGRKKGKNSGKGLLFASGRLSVRLSAHTAAPPPPLRLPCASQRPYPPFLIFPPFLLPALGSVALHSSFTTLAAPLRVATPALRCTTVATAAGSEHVPVSARQTPLAALRPVDAPKASHPPVSLRKGLWRSPSAYVADAGRAYGDMSVPLPLCLFRYGHSVPERRMHGQTQRDSCITVAVALCKTTPLENSLRHFAPRRSINLSLRLAFCPAPLALPLHFSTLRNLACNGTERRRFMSLSGCLHTVWPRSRTHEATHSSCPSPDHHPSSRSRCAH